MPEDLPAREEAGRLLRELEDLVDTTDWTINKRAKAHRLCTKLRTQIGLIGQPTLFTSSDDTGQ